MSGSITFPRSALDKAFTYVKLEILVDEDLSEGFVINEGARPLDLTGKRLELWCRPTFDHSTLIKKLTSDPSAGKTIYFDDPLKGAVSMVMPQIKVAAAFVPGVWKHFLRLSDDYSAQSPVREIWRGDLIVHPGRVA